MDVENPNGGADRPASVIGRPLDESDPGLIAMLRNVYAGIVAEKLEMADADSVKPSVLAWKMSMQADGKDDAEDDADKLDFPVKMTVREWSAQITLSLPHPVPDVRVLIHGCDVTAEPALLDFSTASEITFRVKGNTPGRKLVMFSRMGRNLKAVRGIQTRGVLVEPAFMKYKFQLTATDKELGSAVKVDDAETTADALAAVETLKRKPGSWAKKRYLFAVADAAMLQNWVENLTPIAGTLRTGSHHRSSSGKIRVEGGSNPFGTVPRSKINVGEERQEIIAEDSSESDGEGANIPDADGMTGFEEFLAIKTKAIGLGRQASATDLIQTVVYL
ncbi:hypothetical protein HK101_009627 [Irineochytrium annulatum]|nr:hypothetical protein HK101_009627 [Irineochytrium annulatum]